VNRRQMLKGAAAASIAALSASCTSRASSKDPVSRSQSKSAAGSSGINVLFFGLWAFWYGQPSPTPDATEGMLAFSPDFTTDDLAHLYMAKFKKGHSVVTLEAGIQYSVVPDAPPKSQTSAALWKAAQLHNASMFLHTNQGSFLVQPLSADAMRNLKARTSWLPSPDDIIPVTTIDLQKQPLFAPSNDLTNAGPIYRWPMIQAFSYGNSTSVGLTDGVSTLTGKVNLHLIVQPNREIKNDGGQHAGKAWKTLLTLVPKQDKTLLDISFAAGLPDDMGACSDQVSGVDGDDEISDPCTHGAAVRTTMTYPPDSRVNPSNCAAGCGLEIGP